MNGKEIGAAVVGIAAVVAAALSGALWNSSRNVPRETLPVQEVPPVKSSIPPIGTPFILHVEHLTDWSGLKGGATADAKVVRTVAVHKPVSVQGFFLPGPN